MPSGPLQHHIETCAVCTGRHLGLGEDPLPHEAHHHPCKDPVPTLVVHVAIHQTPFSVLQADESWLSYWVLCSPALLLQLSPGGCPKPSDGGSQGCMEVAHCDPGVRKPMHLRQLAMWSSANFRVISNVLDLHSLQLRPYNQKGQAG